jgi:hypothetical protein
MGAGRPVTWQSFAPKPKKSVFVPSASAEMMPPLASGFFFARWKDQSRPYASGFGQSAPQSASTESS